MANTQYLFWVMAGALTLLFIVIGAFVGLSKGTKKGVITFAVLFIIMLAGALYIHH
ncbi:hypothetical protein [Pantoea agglomerans]|uniref:hypothetical protein n=1 Tax=Enterobacter agglomerans TaxID=549 RepID=UPI0018DA0EF4|nr:hypothetical protein [Pantoea agglomerans]